MTKTKKLFNLKLIIEGAADLDITNLPESKLNRLLKEVKNIQKEDGKGYYHNYSDLYGWYRRRTFRKETKPIKIQISKSKIMESEI